MIHRIY